jgi:hypothetical protein
MMKRLTTIRLKKSVADIIRQFDGDTMNDKIVAIIDQNIRLKKEVDLLQKESTKLRDKATIIVADNEKLREDNEALQDKIYFENEDLRYKLSEAEGEYQVKKYEMELMREENKRIIKQYNELILKIWGKVQEIDKNVLESKKKGFFG